MSECSIYFSDLALILIPLEVNVIKESTNDYFLGVYMAKKQSADGGINSNCDSIVGDNRIHPRGSFRKIPRGGKARWKSF